MSESVPKSNDTERQPLPIITACMGTLASRRVCDYARGGACTAKQLDGGIPGERDCPGVESYEPELLTELAPAIALPRVESMNNEEVEALVRAAFDNLQASQQSFEEYLRERLALAPRTVISGKLQNYIKTKNKEVISPDLPEDEKSIQQLIAQQTRGFYDGQTMQQDGLLYDTAIRKNMDAIAQAMALGYHIELSGEPGIAKTTLAKYMARLNARAARGANWDGNADEIEPIVLSFSSTSEAEASLSEQTFVEGTLGAELGAIARAMQEGRGVILDEFNAMGADQSIFLNDILLKKPGDTVTIAGKQVTIARGFSVIATMNPMTDTQGQRRQGRQQKDSAGSERYQRFDLHYPGAPAYPGSAKETISRLSMAMWTKHFGWRLPDTEQLKLLDDISGFTAELAHMATTPNQDGSSVFGSAEQTPLIPECITPRDLMARLDMAFSATLQSGGIVPATKRTIANKVAQIVDSNNGYLLTSNAIAAVNELQRQYGLNYA